MHIAIIGGGPAGLAAGYQLAKAGLKVEIFEHEGEVGGMARSIDLWGQKVDLGPHRFFSGDQKVNQFWLGILGNDFRMVQRLTRIYYNGQFFNYPLKPGDALSKMGIFEACHCLMSYLRASSNFLYSPQELTTFESFIVKKFGRRLYEMFFKSYTEKLWGIPCNNLDSDFAKQRIRNFSLGEAIKGVFSQNNGRHRTLADSFAYPTGGTGMVYNRIAEGITKYGGMVHLKLGVKRVLRKGTMVTGLETCDGNQRSFDHIISSMPLTYLVKGLGDLPSHVDEAVGALRFRNTSMVYLCVESVNLFPDQWVYVHSPELHTGRITNFRNWTPELYGNAKTSILAMEYWANDDDYLWNCKPQDLIDLAKEELKTTGLNKNSRIIEGYVFRIKRSYPVYTFGYKDKIRQIINFLSGLSGLSAIGRYGTFKYNNQDHSILMGLLASENILNRSEHNLWSVNSDYDTYQEKISINETGFTRAADVLVN